MLESEQADCSVELNKYQLKNLPKIPNIANMTQFPDSSAGGGQEWKPPCDPASHATGRGGEGRLQYSHNMYSSTLPCIPKFSSTPPPIFSTPLLHYLPFSSPVLHHLSSRTLVLHHVTSSTQVHNHLTPSTQVLHFLS